MKVNTNKVNTNPVEETPLTWDQIKRQEGVYSPIEDESVHLIVLKNDYDECSVLYFNKSMNTLQPAIPDWTQNHFFRTDKRVFIDVV